MASSRQLNVAQGTREMSATHCYLFCLRLRQGCSKLVPRLPSDKEGGSAGAVMNQKGMSHLARGTHHAERDMLAVWLP